jgi:hypothetical protein
VRNWRVGEWFSLMREHGLEPELLFQFDLELEMTPWFERQQTAPDRRTGVRALFAGANESARAAFHLDGKPGWFTLPIALIRATKR